MNQKSLFTYFKEAFTVNYFNFRGRARRREFWGFVLFSTLISTALNTISNIAYGGYVLTDYTDGDPMGILMGKLLPMSLPLIYSLVSLLPSVGVAVRRLHDTGRSGLWYLLPIVSVALFLTSFVLTIFGKSVFWGSIFFVTLALMFISGILLLVFFCLDGQRGVNKYGSNPKEEELSALFASFNQGQGAEEETRY